MTLILVALLIWGIWWLVTPHDHGRGDSEARRRRRRGPERPWSRSHEWFDKLKAKGDAKRKHEAEEATKKKLRDLERIDDESGTLPDEVSDALRRSAGDAKRDGTEEPPKKPES